MRYLENEFSLCKTCRLSRRVKERLLALMPLARHGCSALRQQNLYVYKYLGSILSTISSKLKHVRHYFQVLFVVCSLRHSINFYRADACVERYWSSPKSRRLHNSRSFVRKEYIVVSGSPHSYLKRITKEIVLLLNYFSRTNSRLVMEMLCATENVFLFSTLSKITLLKCWRHRNLKRH